MSFAEVEDPTNYDIIPTSPLERYKPLQEDLKKRLATYKKYPKNAVKDKNELADNGFIYIGDGKNDQVQCVFCGIIIDQWDESDDITSEHRRGSRTCQRVIELDRNNFGSQLNGGMSRMDLILQKPSSEGMVPKMRDLDLRLKSFADWPHSNEEKPSPTALAEAGLFYTGNGDHTQCWFCGNLLEEWEPEDVPKVEHDNIFPECKLAIQ